VNKPPNVAAPIPIVEISTPGAISTLVLCATKILYSDAIFAGGNISEGY